MRTGSSVVVCERPDAIALAARFVQATRFIGYGELEMLDSPQGPVLLELNARPWSQVVLAEALGEPILEFAVELMLGRERPDWRAREHPKLEWVQWDRDLLFRWAEFRAGRCAARSSATGRVYGISFRRDPLPALVYAVTASPLGPARLWRR
jgi:predicted ATP-grasp superfamily ATP-dependent carboligase